MPQSGNLYDILGLKRYASMDEVRTKFRQLAVKYHPDKNPDNPEIEELFKEMVAAYNVLSDEEDKRNYDLKLSGFYTYQKVETQEEKKTKRREQVKRMRKRMKEKEEREIKQAYDEANQKIPYKWRYTISIVLTIIALFLILDNWFSYDVINKQESAFFKIFAGYGLSISALVFFLNSIFKKWNAKNIKKPFSFDIRQRISTFFVLYIVLIFNFSFKVPDYYRQLHLKAFGETTQGQLYYDPRISSAILTYTAGGKRIMKLLGKGVFIDLTVIREYDVIVEYSDINPDIMEIKRFDDSLEL